MQRLCRGDWETLHHMRCRPPQQCACVFKIVRFPFRFNVRCRSRAGTFVATKSILKIYEEYKKELYSNRKTVAALQLTGKLEDYLTKGFAYCLFAQSGGELIALSNIGLRAENRRIDLAVIEGDFSKEIDRKNATIRHLIELKYLRNTHRMCFGDACDEISGTLTNLRGQLEAFDTETLGHFKVNLRGGRRDIYGLVFASYVGPEFKVNKEDDEKLFFARVAKRAKAQGLTYNDLSDQPWLQKVYEREPVVALRRKFLVSLKMGLWRANSMQEQVKASAAHAGR